MIIVWYHFWQQSWLMPVYGKINLDIIPRFGFLLVDMMIVLSGFCLFIPYVRSLVYKKKMPSTKEFYIKRIAKIFPSYYFSMIICVIFLIILKDGWFNTFFIKDSLMHFFFVHNWSTDTLLYSNYFGVLWTVAIEVQFYIIFPFIAKRFIKHPITTYLIMIIVGIISTSLILVNVDQSILSGYVNNFFTFIPVFANGMLACLIYFRFIAKKKKKIVK